MTPYTAYELTPGRVADVSGAVYRLADTLADAAAEELEHTGLGLAEARLLRVLFEADGATPAALGARLAAPKPDVEVALGTLARRGLVEQTESGAWLTGEAFGLRRAVRRARERGAVRTRAN
ncbi:MAG TPA: helix-turn-helix domain-containing protein [Rubricoccaceae bacterium]|jgi:hypothetical protein